jgi:hypothetical protein
MPVFTASLTEPTTIGIVLVAVLAASAAGVREVNIRSTGSAKERRHHDETTVDAFLRHGRECLIEIRSGSHRYQLELNPELLAGSLNRLQGRTVRGRRGTKEHTDPRRLWQRLLQYLQLLGDEVGEHNGQPRRVAAGLRQARRVPDANGVGMGGEHDRYRICPRAASTSVEDIAKMASIFMRASSATN